MFSSLFCSVLDIITQSLQIKDYHVFRYNSRGVGGSSGWPSLTGFTEGKDLEAVVDWSIRYVQSLAISNAAEITVTIIVREFPPFYSGL